MSITLDTATPGSVEEIVEAVASWQCDGGPVQLHPGDLGWNASLGAEALAQSLRVWRRSGRVVAVGLLDSPRVVRLGLAPDVDRDAGLAARLVADLSTPSAGVLVAGTASVEARAGTALRDLLDRSGWVPDEPWTPLIRDLSTPVEVSDLRIEVVDARDPGDRVAVQRSSFTGSTFTLGRWHTMVASTPYQRARCLVGYDRHGEAVATATVWSAGPGRPGLLEPLGVHHDHRGHGHGTAISVAAAAALQELGSSSATVCTPSSNVGAVATYVSAGYRRHAEVTEFRRPS